MTSKASAKVVAFSTSGQNDLFTVEVEFWRGILAECNTHRALSKNTSSTRAIPVSKAISHVIDHGFDPEFTKAQPGMKANEPVSRFTQAVGSVVWKLAKYAAIACAWTLTKIGVSKQYAGRLLEPFQYVKAVWSGTDWENFFHLRDHEAAQPEIRELAQLIKKAIADHGEPKHLEYGEWHLPYYKDGYWTPSDPDHTLEEAQAISASCCAQVSYRTTDDTLNKARSIWKKLVPDDGPVHAVPFEHQATPVIQDKWRLDDVGSRRWWRDGVTHRREGDLQACSGNYVGWIQLRQLIPGNCKKG